MSQRKNIERPLSRLELSLEELAYRIAKLSDRQLWHSGKAQDQIDLIVSEIALIKSDLDLIVSEIALIKSDLDLIVSDVDLIKSDVDLIKSDVDLIKSDLDKLKEQFARSELELVKLKNSHQKLFIFMVLIVLVVAFLALWIVLR